MNPLSSLSSVASATGELAADSRALDALKRQASHDPQQAIKSAARQFEAMFMQMVLKSMREATPKSGLLDSASGDLYSGMLDQQLAGAMSGGRSGLAEMIERQLTRHLQPAAAPVGTPAASDSGALRKTLAAAAGSRAAASPLTDDASGARANVSALRVTPLSSPQDADAVPSNGVGGATAQRVFVNRMWDHALFAQRETGLPAKFIIGQAALESGWGSREIAGADGMRSFNLFGIKATAGWQGRTVEATTTEYENGVAVRKVEKFRAYNNYGEAFRDWARLLTANPRYAEVLASPTDAAGFAHGLQRAGYATDPNYGVKLQRVIETAQALRRLS
jgi:flagellar protein FlgJ